MKYLKGPIAKLCLVQGFRMVNGVVGIITDMRSLVVPGIVLALVAHSNGKSVAMGSTPQPPFWPHYSGARSVTLLDGTWNYG